MPLLHRGSTATSLPVDTHTGAVCLLLPPRETLAMNRSVTEAARRIFGNLPHSKGRSGNKVLRKNMIGHKIAEYYPQSTVPDMVKMAEKEIPGVVMNHKREWRQWKRDLDEGRGVSKSKKGQGKRSK